MPMAVQSLMTGHTILREPAESWPSCIVCSGWLSFLLNARCFNVLNAAYSFGIRHFGALAAHSLLRSLVNYHVSHAPISHVWSNESKGLK